MPQLAIDTTNLARRFGRRWALADISLQIPTGTATMVAGRNGSGKSTLLRVLATAIRPDHGAGSVLGFDLLQHREDIRRSTALLAHANYLYESLTARENLDVAAGHLKRGGEGVAKLLERVGLAARADDPVSTFSAGMRKRVSFARVLLQEPQIVFLDEPYAQLDPSGFDLVDSVVRELKTAGVTVLMATHQLERTAELCDLALHLSDGRVDSFGPARGRG